MANNFERQSEYVETALAVQSYSGEPVKLPSGVVGIAADNYAPGQVGRFFVMGVWRLRKATGATAEAGAPVFWDSANRQAVFSGGTFQCGIASKPGVAGSSVVRVDVSRAGGTDMTAVNAAIDTKSTSDRAYAQAQVAGLLLEKAALAAAANAGMAGLQPSRLLNVATRCVRPNGANPNMLRMRSWTGHKMIGGATGVRIRLPGWRVDEVNHIEVATNGPTSVNATLEYPLGTIAGRFQFNGSDTGTIPGASHVDSDVLPVFIPDGAEFRLHYFRETAATSGLTYNFNGHWASDGDGFNSDWTDTTNNPIPTSDMLNAPTTWGALAVIAETTIPSFLFVGDSRGVSSELIASNYPKVLGTLAPVLNSRFPYVNASMAGEGLESYLANNRMRLQACLDVTSHVILELKANDIFNAGKSLAQVIELTRQVMALFKGKVLGITTGEPWDISPSSAAALVMFGFNDLARSGSLKPAAFCIDIADVVETGRNSGLWKPGYATDNRHSSNAGNAAIQAALGGTIFPAAINSGGERLVWRDLALSNAWGNLGALGQGYPDVAQAALCADGRVIMRGLINHGGILSGALIIQFPPDLKPAKTQFVFAVNDTSSAIKVQLNAATGGQLLMGQDWTGGWIDLSSISFSTV